MSFYDELNQKFEIWQLNQAYNPDGSPIIERSRPKIAMTKTGEVGGILTVKDDQQLENAANNEYICNIRLQPTTQSRQVKEGDVLKMIFINRKNMEFRVLTVNQQLDENNQLWFIRCKVKANDTVVK